METFLGRFWEIPGNVWKSWICRTFSLITKILWFSVKQFLENFPEVFLTGESNTNKKNSHWASVHHASSTTLAKKNWDNHAHVAQARDLSSMHAPMFGLRACFNFFGQCSSSHRSTIEEKNKDVSFGYFFVWVPIFDPTVEQYFIQIPT